MLAIRLQATVPPLAVNRPIRHLAPGESQIAAFTVPCIRLLLLSRSTRNHRRIHIQAVRRTWPLALEPAVPGREINLDDRISL